MRGRPVACAFTGHRPEKLPWGENEYDLRCRALRERIHNTLERAYAAGYRHFICGMARGCDTYFCEEALALRARHQDVTVEAAIPCLSQCAGWPEEDKERYRDLLSRCDYETLVQERYTPACMHRRNQYMVNHASLLIAVHDGSPGGTRSTIEYGFRQRLEVIILPVVDERDEV